MVVGVRISRPTLDISVQGMYNTDMTILISEIIAGEILHDLQGRKGFDEWWYGIDENIQKEIEADLTFLVRRQLEGWMDENPILW